MRGHVISLARRPDRRERFLEWNAGKGIELAMFDAVDGRRLRRQELIDDGLIADESLGFSAGALGNALSHHALWRSCVKHSEPIIVFEDDAFLPSHLGEWLAPVTAELAAGCDIFYLGYNRNAVISFGYGGQWCNAAFDQPPSPFDAAVKQHEERRGTHSRCILDTRLVWGTLGYAISPQSAERLLKYCFPLSDKQPVRMYGSAKMLVPYALDGVINVVIQRGLVRARSVFPPLVIGPNDQSDSDVVRHMPATTG